MHISELRSRAAVAQKEQAREREEVLEILPKVKFEACKAGRRTGRCRVCGRLGAAADGCVMAFSP